MRGANRGKYFINPWFMLNNFIVITLTLCEPSTLIPATNFLLQYEGDWDGVVSAAGNVKTSARKDWTGRLSTHVRDAIKVHEFEGNGDIPFPVLCSSSRSRFWKRRDKIILLMFFSNLCLVFSASSLGRKTNPQSDDRPEVPRTKLSGNKRGNMSVCLLRNGWNRGNWVQ